MYYPGQPVLVNDRNEYQLGIYLGYTHETKYPYSKLGYVFILAGKNGDESDMSLFDITDLEPVLRKNTTSLTGQEIFTYPFQKPSMSKVFSQEEATAMRDTFITEMLKTSRTKWFKESYTITIKDEQKKK